MKSELEQHFDVSRIIGIELRTVSEARYTWLEREQKTRLFGLIKRDAYYSEGYYNYGQRRECYGENGCWDAHAYSAESLRESGYIVDDSTKTVYNKAHVTVFLEAECKVSAHFDSNTEASEWVSNLRLTSGKTFEIIIK